MLLNHFGGTPTFIMFIFEAITAWERPSAEKRKIQLFSQTPPRFTDFRFTASDHMSLNVINKILVLRLEA